MALIKCPNCGEEISDRAVKCPHCGYDLTLSPGRDAVFCTECGTAYSRFLEACPKCGCPNEAFTVVADNTELIDAIEETNEYLVQAERKVKKKNGITFIVLGLVIAILGFVALRFMKINTYEESVRDIADDLIDSADQVEDYVGLVHDVWYNSIFDINDIKTNKYTLGASDFNEALRNFYTNDTISRELEAIKEQRRDIAARMNSLKVPSGYEDSYEKLSTLYNTYSRMVDTLINPTGSLLTFTDNWNALDQKCVDDYYSFKQAVNSKFKSWYYY